MWPESGVFFLRISEINITFVPVFQLLQVCKKEALSTKNKGLTREEILKQSKLTNNGHFTKILQDLIDCEFIRSYKGYGKTVRQSIYQLIFTEV